MATGVIYILDPYATYNWVVFTWLVAVAVCLVHATILGLPALYLLDRCARLNSRSAIATGILVGLLPTLGLQVLQFTQSGRSIWPPTLLPLLAAPLFTAFLGGVGAISFMLATGLVRERKHDD